MRFLLLSLFFLSACSTISSTWGDAKTALGFTGQQDLGERRRPVGNPGGDRVAAQSFDSQPSSSFSPFTGTVMAAPNPQYGANGNAGMPSPSFGASYPAQGGYGGQVDPYAPSSNPTMMNNATLPNTYANGNSQGGSGFLDSVGQFMNSQNNGGGQSSYGGGQGSYGGGYGGFNASQLQQQGSQIFQNNMPSQNSSGNYNPFVRHHLEERFVPMSGQGYVQVDVNDDPFLEEQADSKGDKAVSDPRPAKAWSVISEAHFVPLSGEAQVNVEAQNDPFADVDVEQEKKESPKTENTFSVLEPRKSMSEWYQFPNLATVPSAPRRVKRRIMHREFNDLVVQRDTAEVSQQRVLEGGDPVSVEPAFMDSNVSSNASDTTAVREEVPSVQSHEIQPLRPSVRPVPAVSPVSPVAPLRSVSPNIAPSTSSDSTSSKKIVSPVDSKPVSSSVHPLVSDVPKNAPVSLDSAIPVYDIPIPIR